MQDNQQYPINEDADESLQSSVQASREFSSRLKQLLPHFTKTLGILESGVFISSYGHIAAYKEISRHHDAYMTLMGMVGHDLIHHASGFYYLMPQDMQILSKREKQAAACVFALIEYLSDMGLSIENMILSEEPIKHTDLERLYEQFSERLEKIGLNTLEEFLNDGLKKLVETGVMTEQAGASGAQYCLALPVYFYLDIARKVNQDKQGQDAMSRHDLLDEFPDAEFSHISIDASVAGDEAKLEQD